jgi:CheY-like chemotaxis protein
MSVQLAAEKISVLVVDDSADQQLLLRTHFERAGCNVEIASTGEEALAAMSAGRTELVVIDLVLPGMDGWELAKLMKSEHPDCPIAITSVLRPDRYPDADANLPKPFSRASIRSVLGQCVPRWVAA